MKPYYLPSLLLTKHAIGFEKRQVAAKKTTEKPVWRGSFIWITGVSYLLGLILNT